MPRDLDLLPEKELFEKSSSIVEYVRDCEIQIQYKEGDNWCVRKPESKYLINIATPTVKHIPKYTAVLHELSHILYQSPFGAVDKLLKNWTNSDFFFNVYNLLEDQRIESHLTKEYLAYKKRFNTTLRGLGTQIPNEDMLDGELKVSPLKILFSIRCMRSDTVHKTEYFPILEEAMINVEGTDRFGALRILITIKPLLDDYLMQRKQRININRNEDNSVRPSDDNDPVAEQLRNECSADRREAQRERNHISTSEHEDDIIPIDIMLDVKKQKEGNLNNEDMTRIIEEAKERGEVEYEAIQEKILSEAATYDNTPSYIKRIERKTSKETTPDYATANRLNKVFKHLKMGMKPYVDYEGHDVNIDSYINNFVKGIDLGKSFTNMKNANGGSLVISVDGSSSMKSYDRIVIARKLVATLYKSLESIDNIELRGNVWGSDGIGNVGLTDINKISEVERIEVDQNYNGTPTHVALEYSAKTLREMKGQKKLMIIITDGMPNFWKNNVHMQRNHYYNICKKSYKKALRITPNIVFVVVNPRLWVHESMKDIFGAKSIISVPNAEIGSERVIRQFKNLVMGTLV
tara:strand:+ start:10176 stop:11906 length:1731 start_codon:yes stop_codon:yes gene_type:complete